MNFSPKKAKASVQFDLHNHSSLSPGAKVSSRMLVDLAAARGVAGLGICEQDAFWDPSASEHAARRRVRLAMGIEFSCRKAHIIGFGMRFSGADRRFLEDYFTTLRLAALDAARKLIAELAGWNSAVTFTTLMRHAGKMPDKSSILHFLTHEQRMFPDTMSGKAFLAAEGLDPPPYGTTELLDPTEAVALIRRSGGVSILAHPFLDNPSEAMRGQLHALTAAGLHAIEGIYPYRENGYQGPESNEVLQARTVALASLHGLSISGGSGTRYPLGPMQDHRPILPGEYGITAEEAEALGPIFH
ncbi:MAG: hypothetical protein KKB70_04350 [Proteobacteria bacterium]|nr:hypothetical protein [Pseudomonadota bacterium]MBU1610378.1 hypothetical protein [Pseudomonadota bacterium]